MNANVDRAELEKFSALASRWWDPNSEFRPLHQINPLRLDWIDQLAQVKGKRIVDVGCGGGILAESMARLGATVKGIDLAEKPLKVAQLHGLESGIKVDYEAIAAEALAERGKGGSKGSKKSAGKNKGGKAEKSVKSAKGEKASKSAKQSQASKSSKSSKVAQAQAIKKAGTPRPSTARSGGPRKSKSSHRRK